jgi:hypothetical protein
MFETIVTVPKKRVMMAFFVSLCCAGRVYIDEFSPYSIAGRESPVHMALTARLSV